MFRWIKVEAATAWSLSAELSCVGRSCSASSHQLKLIFQKKITLRFYCYSNSQSYLHTQPLPHKLTYFYGRFSYTCGAATAEPAWTL